MRRRERIAVAMSGGADSSCAALLLVRRGYRVEGFTLKMLDADAESEKSCCSAGSLARAAAVCARLGIPHTVFSVTEIFREKVVREFLHAYSAGLTPNPCILCNRAVKFGYLLDRVRALGCDRLATGHYVRSGRNGRGGRTLYAGRDREKDQSYFLAGLTPEQISRICFPLAGWTKAAVQKELARAGLFSAPLRESQDVCFLGPAGSLREYLREHLPAGAIRPGDFTDAFGRILGRHEGLAFYTPGQRRGLNISAAEPLYVKRLDPETDRIILGGKEELLERSFFVKDLNFISGRPESGWMKVRIRHRFRPVLCRLVLLAGGRGRADLLFARVEIPAGQWAVFYRGSRLVAGGEIGRP